MDTKSTCELNMRDETSEKVKIYPWKPVFHGSLQTGEVVTPFIPEDGYDYIIVKTSSNFFAMHKLDTWFQTHNYKLEERFFNGISDTGVEEGIKKIHLTYSLVYKKQ